MWIAWFGGNIKITVKYLQLLRVRHWTKNILIFFPAAFSGRIMEPYFLKRNILGFFIFSAFTRVNFLHRIISLLLIFLLCQQPYSKAAQLIM